jgi:Flp pilus assembly protein TadG
MISLSQSTIKQVARFAKAFASDSDGIILPYFAILFPVFIGLSLLVLEGARMMSLQTQLQNGADALALAGAAELDRLPDAETRARAAIEHLFTNSNLFGSGSRKVEVASIQFYSRLPANDNSPMSAGTLATDSGDARFVSVTARPVALTTILPTALMGGANVITTGASAVAGFDQVICQTPPIYVCNPYETNEMNYRQATEALQHATADPAIQSRLMILRQYNGNGPYEPANYGFIETPTLGTDDSSLIDAIAVTHPAACFLQRGVDFRPGFAPFVREGFNVRFDIYEGAMSGKDNDSDYRPAQNVRKGYVPGGDDEGDNTCTARRARNWPIGSPPDQATGLPLDRTWPDFSRFGQGDWDVGTYWTVNHGDVPLPEFNAGPPPSRYRVYRYEIDHGYVADISPGGESGAPACYRGHSVSDRTDRRVLYAAIINCQSLRLEGDTQSHVPVAAFGKFFLALPLATRSQTDVYAEMIGLVKPGDGISYDVVQLYR